jgi:hypothetical protein
MTLVGRNLQQTAIGKGNNADVRYQKQHHIQLRLLLNCSGLLRSLIFVLTTLAAKRHMLTLLHNNMELECFGRVKQQEQVIETISDSSVRHVTNVDSASDSA